ncbi:MAG TPA: NAD(P)-dependent oxidoreductase [bacterium]|nr:NAD(P)-dependent oxidoreductase [bacterium]
MKVLILGSQGNLGSQLIIAGRKLGHDIIGWDRDDVDLTDWPAVETKLASLDIEVIINTVAYNAVDAAETEPGQSLAYELNRDLVDRLANYCQAQGIILVQYSTDYVFSGDQTMGYREDAQVGPLNHYGQSKVAGEQAIISRAASLNYYIIRTSKLFGPQGSSPAAKASFFDIMLKLAQSGDELKGVDSEESCFTYTPDLARTTWEILTEGKETGIYHVVNSGAATWFGALVELKKLAGFANLIKPIDSLSMPRPAKRPEHSVLKMTKLPALRSYIEALEEYLKIKSN